jgi:hypothetical protein
VSGARVAAVIAAAGAAIAVLAVARPWASHDRGRPMLRPASLFVAPNGSDDGRCTRAAPCRTLARAYRLAKPGQIAEAAAGSYGSQTLPAIAGRSGAAVELRAAAGARVRLGELAVKASRVRVRGMRARHVEVTDTSGVSVVNVSAHGLWVNNVRDLLVKGGSYGGIQDKSPVIIGADPLSYRLTFDGVDFHDAIATREDTHEECLLAVSPQGLTIRNSIFRNCSYFGALIATCCGGTRDPRDVLIENTVFEQTYQWNRQEAPYSMMVSDIRAENFVFRNNTFQTEPAFNATTLINSRMVGNLGYLGSCQDAMTYHHNVWTSLTCSPTDTKAPEALSQFADPARHDWRLRPQAVAIGKADPTDHPARDGSGRPRTGAPDAGAHEYPAAPAA